MQAMSRNFPSESLPNIKSEIYARAATMTEFYNERGTTHVVLPPTLTVSVGYPEHTIIAPDFRVPRPQSYRRPRPDALIAPPEMTADIITYDRPIAPDDDEMRVARRVASEARGLVHSFINPDQVKSWQRVTIGSPDSTSPIRAVSRDPMHHYRASRKFDTANEADVQEYAASLIDHVTREEANSELQAQHGMDTFHYDDQMRMLTLFDTANRLFLEANPDAAPAAPEVRAAQSSLRALWAAADVALRTTTRASVPPNTGTESGNYELSRTIPFMPHRTHTFPLDAIMGSPARHAAKHLGMAGPLSITNQYVSMSGDLAIYPAQLSVTYNYAADILQPRRINMINTFHTGIIVGRMQGSVKGNALGVSLDCDKGTPISQDTCDKLQEVMSHLPLARGWLRKIGTLIRR